MAPWPSSRTRTDLKPTDAPSQPKGDTEFIRRRAPALWIIIGIKLGKALLLALLAAGFFTLIGRDIGAVFDDALRFVRIDPEQRFFSRLGDQLGKITPANLRWLASGSLLYAVLLVVEGIGLIRRSWWAVWLAIGETAFFIPLEILELLERFSLVMLIVLTLNCLIVAYLTRNRGKLFHHHHPHHHG
jgi:uncharacterized membrane protein (DUF2068 family)